LDVLFAKYSVETTLDKLDTQAAPTAEELDQLSDADRKYSLGYKKTTGGAVTKPMWSRAIPVQIEFRGL
jgi:hypothetical protein